FETQAMMRTSYMMMRNLLAFAAVTVLLAQNPQRPMPGQVAPGTPQRPQPGQIAPDAESTQGRPIQVTTTVVVVPTTVLDKHGDYVDGLKPEDFTLYDNGKPQKITADIA